MSKLEVRNVKVIASLSEETTCFTASVYWEGRKIGTASNRGRGGSTDVYIADADKRTEVAAWAKANPIESDFGGESFTFDSIEDHVDELVTQWQNTDDLKKLTRKKVLFVDGGKLLAVNPRSPASVPLPLALAGAIKVVKEKYREAQVLNELPEKEAVALYVKYGVR